MMTETLWIQKDAIQIVSVQCLDTIVQIVSLLFVVLFAETGKLLMKKLAMMELRIMRDAILPALESCQGGIVKGDFSPDPLFVTQCAVMGL